MSNTVALLLLPRLRVQNANAVSGPLSWDFPAPSAFTGFVHALERWLRAEDDIEFGGVGIVCHRFEPQVFRPAGRRHLVFGLTRNPVVAGWKRYEEKPAALVEEGRTHLEVSLLVELLTELEQDEGKQLAARLASIVPAMRLAGGSILPTQINECDDGRRRQPEWIEWPETASEARTVFRRLRRRLLPGFALVQREDLLAQRLGELRRVNGGADALDALLDLCRLNVEPREPDPDRPDEARWEYRAKPGWLAPVPVGYAALSPLYPAGTVANSRDATTAFRFVESIYSLGQWISPHRLETLQQLLWRHHADPDAGIYRCLNRYTPTERIA